MGAYIINIDECSDIGTHWFALHVNNNDVTYFDSFEVEYIPKDIKAFIGHSLSITTNIFRIQASDSVMCGYLCISFTDFMLKRKIFFSPNKFKKDDDLILKYFMNNAYI